MFDRCDPDATAVLATAVDEARALESDRVGTEHVLLALLHHRATLPEALGRLLPDDGAVRRALAARMGEQPPHPQGELLATLGIDLDEVRTAVRRTFGTAAVEQLRQPVYQPWQPWRQPARACTSLLAGQMSVAPRLKRALERALQDATRRRRPEIDPAGLLRAIAEAEGMAARLLVDVGVPPADVVAAVLDLPAGGKP